MSLLKSPAEFLQDAFAPVIAVACSPDAEAACRKNNLRFADMLQPFCKLTQDVQFRDAGNVAHTVRNFRVQFRDLREDFPPQNVAQLYLQTVVDRLCDSEPMLSAVDPQSPAVTFENPDYSTLPVNTNTRWFDAYRDLTLRFIQPGDHEFLRTFIGCLFVASTSCPEPLSAFSNLVTEQYTHQHAATVRYPRWFHSTVLKHFVLLHDVSESTSSPETLFEDLKMAYGPPNCTLLTFNSRAPDDAQRADADQPPNPFGMLMQYDELAGTSIVSLTAASTDPSKPANLMASQGANGNLSKSMSLQLQSASVNFGGSSDIQPSLAADENNTFFNEPLDDNDIAASRYDEVAAQAASLNNERLRTAMPRYGAFLTQTDLERLRGFVLDFLLHGVLPFLERTLRTLGENAATSKKSVQRSVLQLTRKIFSGPNKKGAPTAPTTDNDVQVVYTGDSTELQLRKYADLTFALQQYETAYQTYHTLRRDFQNERASLHLAGVSEMCAICAFLQPGARSRQYPAQYMDEAISTYLNVCRNLPCATRATLLSTEILKSRRTYPEAIAHYLRMTAEDDLRAALFLEQVALCYAVHQPRSSPRKYAFHLALAGFRFGKAGLRRHSIRCYEAAWRVLRVRGWLLAEQLIIVTLARHLHALRRSHDAIDVFSLMFTSRIASPNQLAQSSVQILAYLVEFLTLYQQHMERKLAENPDHDRFAEFPVPGLLFDRTTVLLSDPYPSSDSLNDGLSLSGLQFEDLDNEQLLDELAQLEDTAIRDANAKRNADECRPTRARARLHGYRVAELRDDTSTDTFNGCPVQFRFHFRNTLNVPLWLRNLQLVAQCECKSHDELKSLTTDSIDSVLVEAAQEQVVQLTMQPHHCCTLTVSAITYELGVSNTDSNDVVTSGVQRTATLCVRQTFLHPLKFCVREVSCPCTVRLVMPAPLSDAFPTGALQPVALKFEGQRDALRNFKLATNCPQLLVVGHPEEPLLPYCSDSGVVVQRQSQSDAALLSRKHGNSTNSVALHDIDVSSSTLWLRAPTIDDGQAETLIAVVLYFEYDTQFYVRTFKYLLKAAPTLRCNVDIQYSRLTPTSSHVLLALFTLENHSSVDAAFQITQLTSVSSLYALSEVSPARANGACCIGAQQTARFVARLTRTAPTDNVTLASVALSDFPDSAADLAVKDPTQSPTSDFYLINRRLLTKQRKQHLHLDYFDVDFILFWRSAHHVGQCYMHADSIANAKQIVVPSESNISLAHLVRVAFEFVDSVSVSLTQHDTPPLVLVRHCFSQQLVCIVPLRIHVQKLASSVASVHVRIDAYSKRAACRVMPLDSASKATERNENVADANVKVTCIPRNTPLFGAVAIVGPSKFELQLQSISSPIDIGADEPQFETVALQIALLKPGIFNIAECFEVSACLQRDGADSPFVPQVHVPPSLLMVENFDR